MESDQVYQEKYLKYKNKYEQLKASKTKKQSGGGLWGRAKEQYANITGQDTSNDVDVIKVRAISILRTIAEEFNKSSIQPQIKDLNSEQKNLVNSNFNKLRGDIINKIDAITTLNSANNVNETPEQLLERLCKGDINNEFIQNFKKSIEENFNNVKSKLTETDSQGKELPANNEAFIPSTVSEIKELNNQILVDNTCKKLGLDGGKDYCSQTKINALKFLLASVSNIEKDTTSENQELEKLEKKRNEINVMIENNKKAYLELENKTTGENKEEITKENYEDNELNNTIRDMINNNRNDKLKTLFAEYNLGDIDLDNIDNSLKEKLSKMELGNLPVKETV